MIKKLTFSFWLFLSLIITAAHADSCRSIIAKISHDTETFKNDLNQQKLDWTNLGWLQSHLGKVSPATPDQNTFEYHWTCAKDDANYLTFLTDKQNKAIKISGLVSSDMGSNLFTGCLSTSCVEKNLTVAPTSTGNVCTQIVNEIKSLSGKVSSETYAWQNIDYLNKTLGAPMTENTAQGNGYIWVCSDSPKVALIYLTDKDLLAGITCKANCEMSFVVKKNNQMVVISMTVPNFF